MVGHAFSPRCRAWSRADCRPRRAVPRACVDERGLAQVGPADDGNARARTGDRIRLGRIDRDVPQRALEERQESLPVGAGDGERGAEPRSKNSAMAVSRSSPLVLLTAIRTGVPRRRRQRAMSRSPAAIPARPSTTNSTTSASAATRRAWSLTSAASRSVVSPRPPVSTQRYGLLAGQQDKLVEAAQWLIKSIRGFMRTHR